MIMNIEYLIKFINSIPLEIGIMLVHGIVTWDSKEVNLLITVNVIFHYIFKELNFADNLMILKVRSFLTHFNPIQERGGKKVPYQFFPCNFYKRRN